MTFVENIKVNTTSVICSGSEILYDHPTVYLEIDVSKDAILCPYCGKKFVLAT